MNKYKGFSVFVDCNFCHQQELRLEDNIDYYFCSKDCHDFYNQQAKYIDEEIKRIGGF